MWQSYFPTVTTGDDLFEAVTSDRLSSLQRVAEDVTRGGQIRGMGGVRVRTYNGETTVAVERFRRRLWMGGGGGTTHNFQVTVLGAAGVDSTVANGQIAGITPTLNGGSTLDTVPAPEFTIGLTGTKYIYAVITTAHTDLDDWVYATTVSAVDIQLFTTLQTSNLTTTYYILLATVVDGVVVTPQPIQTSLSLSFADDSSGTSQAYMIPERS